MLAQQFDDQEIAHLLDRLGELQVAGPAAIAEACRLVRNLAAHGLTRKHLDEHPRYSQLSENARNHLLWNAKMNAEVPDEVFEIWLSEGVNSPNFSFNYVRQRADRYRAEQKRIRRAAQVLHAEGMELYVSDIAAVQKLRLGTAAAVVTDPPYDRGALPLWTELVRFAGRTLKDHGWLVALSGNRWLPEVFAAVEAEAHSSGLRYCWTMAEYVPGPTSQSWIDSRNPINTTWKPLLVYSKGTPSSWPDQLNDFLRSEGRDKEHHDWGQSENVYEVLVDKFSEPGELVTDPFLGGGTTARVAQRLGRAFEGFDIDENAVTETVLSIQQEEQ